MYTKGLLERSKPGDVYDSRADYKEVNGVFLPHSCDCWVIGGVEEIDLLIEDLRKAKEELLK